MKKLNILAAILFISIYVNAQTVEKVTNINYSGDNGLNPRNLTDYKSKLYFFGTNDKYINRLMLTDGTETGVKVVKQIDSVLKFPSLKSLTLCNNLLIFKNDSKNQLWKSDGTAAGTSLITKIVTGYNVPLTVMGNHVYFGGDATLSNPMKDQLWKSDGTTAGTVMVKMINPTGPAGIAAVFAHGGKIYFSASNGTDKSQLWVSDGTDGGTMMLKKINSSGDAYPHNFAAYNGKVYFSADDGAKHQLWVTDGTSNGTEKITDGNPGYGITPKGFVEYKGKLFFNGLDAGSFYQLWSTDGTKNGTVKIKTNYGTASSTRGFNPSHILVHNNKMYMSGYDSVTNGNQLWESDGTTMGTKQITGTKSGFNPIKLTSFKGKIIMLAYDTITKKNQVWHSDGTIQGTKCPKPPDTWSSSPVFSTEAFVPFNNALYFNGAYSYFADYQLCRYLDAPSAISDIDLVPLSVFPNPAEDFLQLRTESNVRHIILSDYLGKVIKEVDSENITSIEMTNLRPGIYLLVAEVESGAKYFQRVVKK